MAEIYISTETFQGAPSLLMARGTEAIASVASIKYQALRPISAPLNVLYRKVSLTNSVLSFIINITTLNSNYRNGSRSVLVFLSDPFLQEV